MDTFFALAAPVPNEETPNPEVPADSEQFGSNTTSQHCIIA
ncbi:B mating type pheromone precursor [Gelatoporia subvermispora B]|uniref:B mating type pheromone n=1 Tax=Ceriporiopsis subvermispora (strain B) TaxID=914234 RepID=M2QDU6_CERS8|nr:B mating type pheromone precursor [Gelatoporia subvermispora B]